MPLRRWLLLLPVCLAVYVGEAAAQPAAPPRAEDLRASLRQLSPMQRDEVLWLARCVYSESNRPHEQRLVAWVVRNRVETGFRGNTYREVVLQPRQFSAFNEPTSRRSHILGLDEHSASPAWRQALQVALEVYRAPASKRPFQITTRHFYSPVSMEGNRAPDWAENARPLSSARLGVDPWRFRFFDNIEDDAGPTALASDRPAAQPSSARAAGRRLSTRLSLRHRGFSGRVKRPVRPHLSSRLKR